MTSLLFLYGFPGTVETGLPYEAGYKPTDFIVACMIGLVATAYVVINCYKIRSQASTADNH